ncbi:hypothetical protein [Sphingomonas sp. RS2018]
MAGGNQAGSRSFGIIMSKDLPMSVSRSPEAKSGRASAERGIVMLDGPGPVAVAMTPDAADGTAESLHEAAGTAREQSPTAED